MSKVNLEPAYLIFNLVRFKEEEEKDVDIDLIDDDDECVHLDLPSVPTTGKATAGRMSACSFYCLIGYIIYTLSILFRYTIDIYT